nr:retrotransposon protein, putative, Ty1-copia subclass [Tanacetum cinerariifolium]
CDSADKLHQRSVKCIFVGYPKETMGYKFYFPPENKVIVARYGNFIERDLISQKFSGRDNDLEDDHMDTLPSQNTSKILVESESLGSPPELILVYEDIYMEQPEGYVDPKYPNCVCKLQIYIYGLKQASRQWNKRFDEEIKEFGFIQNHDEPCVYRKASGSDVVFLILYVADILIMGNNIPGLKEVKDYLGKCFSMKDLGEAAYILGIKIYKDRSRWLIGRSQSAYIDKILKKHNMHNSKKGYLPMEVKHDLSNELYASTREEVAYMKKVPYASAVGSIMYDVRCTRPNVEYERYVLVYGGKPDTELDVTVDWKSKKQTTTAMHSAQAKYVDASKAVMEAVWIRKFVGDLGLMPLIYKPINIYCDNSAAIIFANEPGIMKGARNFLRRYHYVREQVETGEIKLIKVHTHDNLADPFTKALPRGMVI